MKIKNAMTFARSGSDANSDPTSNLIPEKKKKNNKKSF
jgi:hypothetical protein